MSYGNYCIASSTAENLELIEEHGNTSNSRDIEDLRKVLTELIKEPGRSRRRGKWPGSIFFENILGTKWQSTWKPSAFHS
jgi:hypothetical protein